MSTFPIFVVTLGLLTALGCSAGADSGAEGAPEIADEAALATSSRAKLKGTYAGRGELSRLVLSEPDDNGEGTFKATLKTTTISRRVICKRSPCPRTETTLTTRHDGSYKLTSRSIRFSDPDETSDLIDTFRYSFGEDDDQLVLESDAMRFKVDRSR